MSPYKKLLLLFVIIVLVVGSVYAWLIYGRGPTRVAEDQPEEIKVINEMNTFIESDFILQADSKPNLPTNTEGVLGGTWNKDRSKYLFLDVEDERLKLRAEEYLRSVTSLKELTPPLNFFWSEDEEYALIADKKDFYFIGIETGSRKKLLSSFEPQKALWTSNQLLLSDKEDNIYELSFKELELKATSLEINLENSISTEDEKLITYEVNGSDSKALLIDLSDMSEQVIGIREGARFKDLYYDKNKKVAYFFEDFSDKWYEIRVK